MDRVARLTLTCRMKCLEAGLWSSRDGSTTRLAEMADDHLINALLGALEAREPAGITSPLAAEIDRRGLQKRTYLAAERRDPFWNKSAGQN